MNEYEIAPAVTADLCPACKGLWLDEGELGRLAGTKTDLPSLKYLLREAEPSKRKCARCRVLTLTRIPYAPRAELYIDYCQDCHGVFVASSKLPFIEAVARQSHVEGFYRKKSRRKTRRAHRRVRRTLLGLCVVGILQLAGFLYWPRLTPGDAKVVTTPIAIDQPPYQSTDVQLKPLQIRRARMNFTLTPVARYVLRGQVVSRDRRFHVWDAVAMPTDLVIGWGEPLKAGEERPESQLTRVRIIPANDRMDTVVWNAVVGDRVQLEGFLVNVDGPWNSRFLTRVEGTESGDGTFEILYLLKARINDREY